MIVDALTTFFYLPRVSVKADTPKPVPPYVTPLAVIGSYNPLADTVALKNNPEAFEYLRNNYRYRSEI